MPMRSGISGPRHRAATTTGNNKLPTQLPIHSSVTTNGGEDGSSHHHHRNGGGGNSATSRSSSHGKVKRRFLMRMAIKCRNVSRPFLPLVAFTFVFWIAFIMPLSQLPPVPRTASSSSAAAEEATASMPARMLPQQSQSASQEEQEATFRIKNTPAARQDRNIIGSSITEDHSSMKSAASPITNDKESNTVVDGPRSNNNDVTTSDATHRNKSRRRILSLYLESPTTLDTSTIPLPRRTTSAAKLTKLEFPHASSCHSVQEHFPINDFPVDDPYLPWIHDYFVIRRRRQSATTTTSNKNNDDGDDISSSSWQVQFVAQNKRRCETGRGKEIIMKHWEPQMSLFQPVPIVVVEEQQQQQVNDSSISSSTARINDTILYKLSSLEHATHPETRFLCQFHHDQLYPANSSSSSPTTTTITTSVTTLSVYPFNYEFVLWRKHKATPMFVETGRDVEKFEFSQLLFACPIPPSMMRSILLQQQQQESFLSSDSSSSFWLDVIPIRTPARRESMLLSPHLHATRHELRGSGVRIFNATHQFGTHHILPSIVDSGRWANLPICLPSPRPNRKASAAAAVASEAARSLTNAASTTNSNSNNSKKTQQQPRHYFVACTWTAAAYQRRGDATTVSDSEDRLREWILFHKSVGLDHLYIYDNTDSTTTTFTERNSSNSTTTTTTSTTTSTSSWTSPLKAVVQEFDNDDDDFVTYIPWHATVCSNNRPNHANPGERSSQYAAEASCRERHGSDTEWMAFIDTDEYLVPMMMMTSSGNSSNTATANTTSSNSSTVALSWKPLLELKKQQGYHVLKMRSTRGRPREDLMVVPADTAAVCVPHNRRQEHLATDPCLVPRANETFLRVYNCDYIKPPLPDRFQRAMKQIYRPAFVLSHFVHYSTITAGMARYFPETATSTNNKTTGAAAGGASEAITRELKQSDWGDVFLDDLTEGRLIHAKTVLPHETMTRNRTCYLHSKQPCIVGRACSESTLFSDEDHTKNIFVDEQGNFCNCWINSHVEHNLIPRLEAALASHNAKRQHQRG